MLLSVIDSLWSYPATVIRNIHTKMLWDLPHFTMFSAASFFFYHFDSVSFFRRLSSPGGNFIKSVLPCSSCAKHGDAGEKFWIPHCILASLFIFILSLFFCENKVKKGLQIKERKQKVVLPHSPGSWYLLYISTKFIVENGCVCQLLVLWLLFDEDNENRQ